MYQKREKRKSVSKIESKLEVACAMEKNKTRTGDWEAEMQEQTGYVERRIVSERGSSRPL